jgi:hypothetical protein
MPTVVTYNGITIYGAMTRRFEQVPQYDTSGTDVVFSRFHMSFEGLVHFQGTPQTAPVWTGSSGALFPVEAAYNSIRTALWQPRRALKVVMGEQPIFECKNCG